jgi:site-specific recombinase XerD
LNTKRRAFVPYLCGQIKNSGQATKEDFVENIYRPPTIPLIRREEKERKCIDAELVFNNMDIMRQEMKDAGINVYPLMRDKVVFYLMYALGLRSSEVLNLNVGSFHTETTATESDSSVMQLDIESRFGRKRTIAVLDDGVLALLKNYVENVRPHFVLKSGTNEPALFLSSRGYRLSISVLQYRFKDVLDYAGLNFQGYGLFSLRYTGISHMLNRVRGDYTHLCTAGNPLTASSFRHQIAMASSVLDQVV